MADTHDFDDPGQADSAAAFDALLAESSRQVGPYKLLQEIGVGGMGTVWLAEQEKPVRRRVAVKLIKAGRADKQIIARFEAERQALSMMDHPNIAKVLDAGTAEGGTPYFVMELVQGDPITKYCDRNRLTPRERLELFIPVCQAIQHAHQKGIIHRDLKPSNVLVHVVNERPIAKVIDFGLAKALQHQTKLTDKTIFTEFGQVVGTVQYMSPEQARTDAIDVDTRSDIYSLGVMLYELMAGSTPLDEQTLNSNAVLQLLELVREQEPPRPSQRLGSSTDRLSSISDLRQVAPAKLQQILQGDLDWIIMKALEKDRTRRYPTANDFADDVQRYLAGDAVDARPPTTGYRVRKFIRKHRALVSTMALFIAVLAAGIVGTTAFALKANQSRKEAEESRLHAEASARRSNDVLEIVTNAFQSVDPTSGSDSTMTAKDVLLNAEKSLEESELDSEGRMALLSQLTVCFKRLGEYEAAFETAEESLRLHTEHYGERDPATLLSRHDLGVACKMTGRLEQALSVNEQTFQLRKEVLGDDHPDTCISMNALAQVYADLGRVHDSLAYYERAFQTQKNALGEDHDDTLISMSNLAHGYTMVGRYDESLAVSEKALALKKVKYGEDHPTTLTSMNNLAIGYMDMGRFDDAVALHERTLEVRKVKLGDDHPTTLTSMANLALAYRKVGQHRDSMAMNERVLALRRAKLGNDHPNTLLSMNNLALSYSGAGQHEEALKLREQTLELQVPKLGRDHPWTLQLMSSIAFNYAALDRLEEAIELHEQTLELRKTKLGNDHPSTLKSMGNLAHCYKISGRHADAVSLFEQAVALQHKRLGDDHPDTMRMMSSLADAYVQANQFEQAKSLLETCWPNQREKEPDTWQTFYMQSLYGGVLLKLGQVDKSINPLTKGYAGLVRVTDTIPASIYEDRMTQALERLIQLAEAQHNSDDVVKWQSKLDELVADDD